MPLTPCYYCGHNFMMARNEIDGPKACNCCELKYPKNKEGKKVEKFKLLIECSREDQIKIEELCSNGGFSISEYFLRLHNEKCSKETNKNSEQLKEEKNYHNKDKFKKKS
jgi:hypothetical protein